MAARHQIKQLMVGRARLALPKLRFRTRDQRICI